MNTKKQDNSLILLILGIIIVACAWKFGFNDMNNKTDKLKTEIDKYNQLITTRTAYKNESAKYEDEKAKFEKQMQQYTAKFPSEIHSEDILKLADNLQNLTGTDESLVSIKINSISITEPQESYSSDGTELKGYVENVVFDFDYTSYSGLKRMIDYINSYDNRCNVIDVQASYNTTSAAADEEVRTIEQCLSGTISFNMFYINGGDYSNYKAPEAGNYSYGVTNPFLPGVDGAAENTLPEA